MMGCTFFARLLALGLTNVLPAAIAVPSFAQAAAVPAYDVVSIKVDKGGEGRTLIDTGQGKYSGTNVTLKSMLRYAFDLTMIDQVAGLQGAMDAAHFDVEAKMDADTVEALKKLSKDDSAAERRLMLQAMLADRFQLKVHHEQRELGMYDLVIAKGGLKLKEADPNNTYANGIKPPGGNSGAGIMRMGRGELTAQAIPMPNLVTFLAQLLHKQVMDKTGLTGKYDMQLKWQPDETPAESHETAGGETLPSMFTALQEELGLRLDAVKGPVDTIVVDHVEMPTEN